MTTRGRGRPAALAALLCALLAVPAGAAAQPARPGPAPAASSQHHAGVLVNEVSLGGPSGPRDSIVELVNAGDQPVSIADWRVFPCGSSGSRGSLWAALPDVTLAPGELFLLADEESPRASEADATFAGKGNQDASGVWVEDADAVAQDRLALSPASRDSACGLPLPATLDAEADESYQRVSASGDVHTDFITATATPGAATAAEPAPGFVDAPVQITEITSGGPDGSDGEFLEVQNTSASAADLTGWSLSFCTVEGATTDPRPFTFPAGSELAAGEVLVLAPSSSPLASTSYGAPRLDPAGAGVLLRDDEGVRRDGVGLYEQDADHAPAVDSACVRGTSPGNRLDLNYGQTYQRTAATGDNATDFVIGDASPGQAGAAELTTGLTMDRSSGVRITEIAHNGEDEEAMSFAEVTNTSADPVSVEGWTVQRCAADGRRSGDQWVTPLSGALAPGEALLLAEQGGPFAPDADRLFTEALTAQGYGLLVRDAQGEVVDRVGVLRDRYSPCIDTLTLDEVISHELELSYQRFADTGDNRRDFVHAARTPGTWAQDLRADTDIDPERLAPVDVPADPRAEPATDLAATQEAGTTTLSATAQHTTGADVQSTFATAERIDVNERASSVYTGSSDQAPPTTRRGEDEQRHHLGALTELTGDLRSEANGAFPYQRFELMLPDRAQDGAEVVWTGSSLGGHELQLYGWNYTSERWDLLTVGSGRDGSALTLTATLAPEHQRGVRAEILVQDGPASEPAFTEGADETFEDPGDYDFSIGYLPDPQELTYGYRWAYANQIAWLVSNAEARNIEYVSNIGDLTQWWMWGTHLENQAREQFETAQAFQDHLTDAGIPNGAVPGNHDNKWGRDNDLYNEYFGPGQIAGTDWFGGSLTATDASSHYDLFEVQGVPFLALNIGYPGWFSADDTLSWAAEVIETHPDHNVLVFTHDYLQRDGEPGDADDRWNAVGYRIWEDLVLPHENVKFVLGGHVNGQAYTLARDVGGVPGRVVPQMLSNYQGYQIDGEKRADFLRLLQIDVDSGTISVNTYSPSLAEHNSWRYASSPVWTPEHDEFLAPIQLTGGDRLVRSTGLALTQEPVEVGTAESSAGERTSVDWAADAGQYLWWVDSTDRSAQETPRSEPALLTVG